MFKVIISDTNPNTPFIKLQGDGTYFKFNLGNVVSFHIKLFYEDDENELIPVKHDNIYPSPINEDMQVSASFILTETD